MADVIRKATNRFTKGLVMDFSPENTKNEVLTHALNATLLTFNGNELSLQNDMGNARVETAYLPEGYMPVGTCEYGGIIYIVSYNPLEDKSQIGCFPSPERNMSSDELGLENKSISRRSFQNSLTENGEFIPDGTINNTSQYVLLRNDNLNPGDKFLICSNKEILNERLSDLLVKPDENSEYIPVSHPVLALNVVSIEDSGKIIYLNSDIRQYEVLNTYTPDGETDSITTTYKYHILGDAAKSGSDFNQAAIDIDNYRNVLSSGYSVFKSKTSGKLAILAELITIDSYSVTHELRPKRKILEDGSEVVLEGNFDVIIHTEVTPQVTPDNYNTVPKLQYYYLKRSQGYVQTAGTSGVTSIPMFNESIDEDTGNVTIEKTINPAFERINLSDIYTPTTGDLVLNQTLTQTGQFNFPKTDTYHGRMKPYDTPLVNGTTNSGVFSKFTEGKYHRIKKSQVISDYENYYKNELSAKFYYYNPDKTGYTKVPIDEEISESYTYYVQESEFEYEDVKRNPDYENDTLYKLVSIPQAATETELQDVEIEKFQLIEVHTYRVADPSEWADADALYQKDASGDKYTEITGLPVSGQTYYLLQIDEVYTSIGKGEIKAEDYPGGIYYYPTVKDFIEVSEDDKREYFDFDTYPEKDKEPWGYKDIFYKRSEVPVYRVATDSELLNFKDIGLELYYNADYVYMDDIETISDTNLQFFMTVPVDTYVSFSKFEPNVEYNYIEGYDKPVGTNEPEDGFPKDDPISLYTVADFIPSNLETDESIDTYSELTLANIKIPRVLSVNKLDLNFKYQYTIVPCMNYGRLDHLAVSNTVDFNNLHAFDQSTFTDWRYHIDGNQLRLTFGSEIFDTFEDDKVDALFLEFYDHVGFAGSLEINNKKSYSGTFTKLIQLNSLGGLSKKRVLNNTYDQKFKRNINITKVVENGSTKYMFNNNEVVYSKSDGWIGIQDADDDCGVLYSNIIYGVKAYLRRTTKKGMEFLHKKDMFLFTLPIYNDYYYDVSDFSTLINPKLEMQLTYKLIDNGTKIPYNGNGITNGYNEDDLKTINDFTNQATNATALSVNKYFEYTGESKLYLEVGLRDIYSNLNLKYDPYINKIFEYRLKLVSDVLNKSFNFESGKNNSLSTKQILSYVHSKGELSEDLNNFGFNENYTSEITGTDLSDKVFLYDTGNNPVSIKYNFVVGYNVNMSNIVTKEFPVTTVCALYHKQPNGLYNLDDFNMEEYTDGSTTTIFNTGVYFNTGIRSESRYGICKQQATTGDAQAQLAITECDFKLAVEELSPGKLNSGEPMRNMLPYIGKLTFCQPHAHAITDDQGVNVHGNCDGANGRFSSGHNYHVIGGECADKEILLHTNKAGGAPSYDNTYGSIPVNRMFKEPRYNLVLNTEKAIYNQSEFISTMHYKTTSSRDALYANTSDGWMQWISGRLLREFVGLDGNQLTQFNKKLLKTMSGVFAFNPDYGTHSSLSGDLNIEDLEIMAKSTIINDYSKFHFGKDKSLNDYIYFNNITISDYLNSMNEYSDIEIVDNKGVLPQLQFIPDITYCGSETSPYLITSLTYNFPVDSSIVDDFNVSQSNLLVYTSDGKKYPLKGVIDSKALYGFDEDNVCLYQLDVSSYTIGSDGTVKPKNRVKIQPHSIIPCTRTSKWGVLTSSYTLSSTYNTYSEPVYIRGTSLTLNDLAYDPTKEHRLCIKNNVAEYKGTLRPHLFYGDTSLELVDSGNPWFDDPWESWGDTNNSWDMDNVTKNRLCLYTGPCFDPDKL